MNMKMPATLRFEKHPLNRGRYQNINLLMWGPVEVGRIWMDGRSTNDAWGACFNLKIMGAGKEINNVFRFANASRARGWLMAQAQVLINRHFISQWQIDELDVVGNEKV